MLIFMRARMPFRKMLSQALVRLISEISILKKHKHMLMHILCFPVLQRPLLRQPVEKLSLRANHRLSFKIKTTYR